MRIAAALAAVVGLAALSARAQDDPPEGMVGVQMKAEGGKLVIVSVIKKGPAEKAGVKADDVLLKINDYKIKDNAEMDDLQAAIKEVGKYKVGDKVKLTVKRADKEMVIEVTVGKRADVLKELENEKGEEKKEEKKKEEKKKD